MNSPYRRAPNLRLPDMRFFFLRGWVLGIGLLALAAQGAGTVVLHLRNGDRLTGTIQSEDAKSVTLRTIWKQTITLPADQIQKREQLPEETAVKPAGPPIVAAPAPSKTPVVTPAVTPAPPKPKPPKLWHADLQFGLDMQKGTRDLSLYYTRSKLTYGRGSLRSIFDYSYYYGETAGAVSANRMDGLSQTDLDFGKTKKFFASFLGGAGYDEIRKIDLGYQFGPGVGYHLITRTNFILNTMGGMNYQSQHFSNRTKQENFYYRVAEDFTWKAKPKMTVIEKFEFLPQAEKLGKYRFRYETTVSYALLQHVSLNLSVIDIYDTQHAVNVLPNDLQIHSSIGVKF